MGGEVLHSGQYWQTVRANRAARLARQSDPSSSAPPTLKFEHQRPIITFIPGRAAPLYSHLSANGSQIPFPGEASSSPSPDVPYTVTRRQSVAIQHLGRNAKPVSHHDADADLLARLAASRAKQEHEEQCKRLAKKKVGSWINFIVSG